MCTLTAMGATLSVQICITLLDDVTPMQWLVEPCLQYASAMCYM